jgi:hypothetical protein
MKTLILDKFGKRKRVRYTTYLGAYEAPDGIWREGQDPILYVDQSEDMYALMAAEYRGVVTAVVRRADWLRGVEVSEQ